MPLIDEFERTIQIANGRLEALYITEADVETLCRELRDDLRLALNHRNDVDLDARVRAGYLHICGIPIRLASIH